MESVATPAEIVAAFKEVDAHCDEFNLPTPYVSYDEDGDLCYGNDEHGVIYTQSGYLIAVGG
jgi:hypothetical protein